MSDPETLTAAHARDESDAQERGPGPERPPPRSWLPRGRVAIALLVIVLIGGAGRAYFAANPHTEHLSTDERSYANLAVNLVEKGKYGGSEEGEVRDPLHWPPGTPVLFAISYLIAPEDTDPKRPSFAAAYWSLWLVGTALIVVAFGIASLLAGPGSGLLAAGAVAFYPPLIFEGSDLLSEPLGALLVAVSVLTLLLAWREPTWWRWALCGLALALAVLTRADLLLIPFIAAAVVAIAHFRPLGWRRALASAGCLVAGALVLMIPWSIIASSQEDKFVPVTTGSGPALYVGTYLPGKGGTGGLKQDCKRTHPPGDTTCERAKRILDEVAARHPELDRSDALSKEARENLTKYPFEEPFEFGKLMLEKVRRMWLQYAHGGGRDTKDSILYIHGALVMLALAGLLLGLWRTRHGVLAFFLLVILEATALHTLATSYPRYALPLLPALVATGIAGISRWRSAEEPRRPLDWLKLFGPPALLSLALIVALRELTDVLKIEPSLVILLFLGCAGVVMAAVNACARWTAPAASP
jgi:4-amino-4-deoxy-L-arabinose transferase-like glycosyltransferase